MLFISPHRNMQVFIRPERRHHHPATGKFLRYEPHIYAQFEWAGAPPCVVDVAMRHFEEQLHAGLPAGVSPTSRISTFDSDLAAETHGWDDETKQEVEEKLLSRQGVAYIRVEPPRLEPLWPTYDKTPRKKIAERVRALGVSVDDVLAYERQNANRADVIAALEGMKPTDDEVVAA